MASTSFPGFPADTLKFLRALAKNNDRAWFEKNKARYEAAILEPSLAFIAAMSRPIGKLSNHVLAEPKKSGGSLMRIYRDTRFSKDKSPYKTNIGISFRHESGKDVHAPGFYFHVDPTSLFIGAGVWHPDPKSLVAIREKIAAEPTAWKRIRDAKAFQASYRLEGESLKRPPRGLDPDHPMIDDLKRKDFIGVHPLTQDLIESPDLVETVTARFRDARPLMGFLCDAIGVPF